MRLRNVKNAKDIVNRSRYVIKNPEQYLGEYQTVFPSIGPIHVEIGTGKGDFIIEMAKNNPDTNFIGIEMYESVLVRAIQKLEDMDHLPNLLFMCMDADKIDSVFVSEVNTIYLNFSDPWPKKRHEKRRLTSPYFITKYDAIFEGKGHIVLKTDNINLFAYSIETLSTYGYEFKKVSLDLANEDIENVETEYEKKYKEMGIKINYLDALKER